VVDKDRIRTRKGLIREILMNGWDPIGVADVPEAADECDMYIGDIYALIARGTSAQEISSHFRAIEVERIELTIPDAQRALVAKSLEKLNSLVTQ
jgi:hypothetical protein